MRTILDEILMEEYPSFELHECNCGCSECKENMEIDLETMLEDMEDETTVSNTPTPGAYYQIKRGDNLLKVVGKAYKVGEGEERLKLAQMVNNDSLNRKFWRKPDNVFERTYFKDGIISFNPRFTCSENQKVATSKEKKCFAKIYIPQRKKTAPLNKNCGIPLDSVNTEISSRYSNMSFENASLSLISKPYICFYQKHWKKSHLNTFLSGASAWAKKIKATSVNEYSECTHKIGPSPYNTGADILNSIKATHDCLNSKIGIIHFFGHSGFDGIYDSSNSNLQKFGLYSESFDISSPFISNREKGTRFISDIDTSVLSQNVAFILHGCNTAFSSPNFAQDLFNFLSASLDNPTVIGHYSFSCPGSNKAWMFFSKKYPNGIKSTKLVQPFYSLDFVGCGKKT